MKLPSNLGNVKLDDVAAIEIAPIPSPRPTTYTTAPYIKNRILRRQKVLRALREKYPDLPY